MCACMCLKDIYVHRTLIGNQEAIESGYLWLKVQGEVE
jgi:hypothetical protein